VMRKVMFPIGKESTFKRLIFVDRQSWKWLCRLVDSSGLLVLCSVEVSLNFFFSENEPK
jgi:hypothetical protein